MRAGRPGSSVSSWSRGAKLLIALPLVLAAFALSLQVRTAALLYQRSRIAHGGRLDALVWCLDSRVCAGNLPTALQQQDLVLYSATACNLEAGISTAAQPALACLRTSAHCVHSLDWCTAAVEQPQQIARVERGT